uniref:Acetyl-coenzyme A carboxylase carboxyl transferase subunit beta, chloroplastic n=1 Tax=Fagopyrum esculentum subsp. ancestrale TaxID=180217 RepID=ACCD_FAGEA|nr:acetyl-CoA carboxylase beta subunit [Fagopyrum esculentum subsp. ancestrale]B2XWL4.1 RecName: Full=Acetyl-coenzyme A carboxylase carboxyl transferase subunit beta, chloroplastic; Short=ACCase subunit beta; Short=Acetyl-CoA carboxylase carboxyltransferase subunit beta [Fagopyrum esculentum subsp. ancestrale]ABY79741.1 acetyl-coA carboxylase beta subunit [Fagopyrum esculentum subsp. ancestrale]
MEKWWFNSMLSKEELGHRCGLSKSMDSLDPIDNINSNENMILNFTEKSIHSWSNGSSYSNLDLLFIIGDIPNLISDETFLIRDRKGETYSVYFDIENKIVEIDNYHSFSNYWNSSYGTGSKSNDTHYDLYMYDTKSSLNNHINGCIDSYLHSQMRLDNYVLRDSDHYGDNYIFDDIKTTTKTNGRDKNLEVTKKYRNLWIQCENCYELNYKKLLKSKMRICDECGYHLKMSSSERIELSIDPGTWEPMDEDMVSTDPIEFHSQEEPYKDRINSYQKETGLTDAVQTGIGQLNGIPVAIGVMDFQFMGGSMGSVVGEKITRLAEYATNQNLPLIIVCASGGARMQEGSLSLMQMAKISSALFDYQSNKKLFYVSILTSPTTGGVTASFGMLGDIIISEPSAYIAFAGKRVIEETLNTTVPEGSQEAEYLFDKGLFDPIVPRNPLKGVLSELFRLHAFFPLNQNSIGQ